MLVKVEEKKVMYRLDAGDIETSYELCALSTKVMMPKHSLTRKAEVRYHAGYAGNETLSAPWDSAHDRLVSADAYQIWFRCRRARWAANLKTGARAARTFVVGNLSLKAPQRKHMEGTP